jgi:hypothetical protein
MYDNYALKRVANRHNHDTLAPIVTPIARTGNRPFQFIIHNSQFAIHNSGGSHDITR